MDRNDAEPDFSPDGKAWVYVDYKQQEHHDLRDSEALVAVLQKR